MVDPYELLALLHNTIAIALWSFSAGLVLLIVTRKRWPWWVRGACLGVIAAFFVFKVFLPWHRDEQYKKEWRAYKQKAYAYFHEQCAKDSGRFVYKPVETPQESVYIMKPRRRASQEDLKNQFWMGDPYMGAVYQKGDDLPEYELRKYIGSGNKYGDEKDTAPPYFSFVEIPDLDGPNQIWRYTYEPTGHMKENGEGLLLSGERINVQEYPEKKLTRIPTDTIQSRYGFIWEDLSTPEGRKYWVAKSSLQIIDLQTHEVIAKRIGYLIEGRSFGRGKKGWYEAWGGDTYVWKQHFCPSRSWGTDEEWIRSVLLNIPFR
jgi:hypothetical protein